MSAVSSSQGSVSVKAYSGDAKTLLAFNCMNKNSARDLAGFTIQCQPPSQTPYYLQNMLRFETPGNHAQDAREPATSSLNAPIHRFRWLHVPGSLHQGLKPSFGKYVYTVTPRYFDQGSLKPLDPTLSVSVPVDVQPFQKNGLRLGFTRGFTQSQAFVHHFGLKALIHPKAKELLFDTAQISGINSTGQKFTFKEEYEWLGFTARERIFELLNEVLQDKSLTLKVFAYDLNEPDLIEFILQLAKQGRIQIILDNAALHHAPSKKEKAAPTKKASSGKTKRTGPTAEDQFEALFVKAAKHGAAILRGKFKRYSHDKVFIVSDKSGPRTVMTGSTNFSVTGLYVNSNHVLIFADRKVAATYAEVFDAAWQGEVKAAAFVKSKYASQTFSFASKAIPRTEITFSPHTPAFAGSILQGLASRIAQEETKNGKAHGSVLFAVMELKTGSGPVFPVLNALHAKQRMFSYGISDSPDGIYLYSPGNTSGVLVTGKPAASRLPPPFDQVPSIGGVGHQIHHKFIVCGFNGTDPVVYCGSSNLAEGGEESNGDNLLAIHDADVATVFAIEALALVDHFDFLDRCAAAKKVKSAKPKFASKPQEAAASGWFLSTTDQWARRYFDSKDLRCRERELFGG
jgi:hypothetical protein